MLLAVWAVLGWMYPYTLDDYYWGTMKYVFPSPENGRYAGHVFSLILTRSRTLRMLGVAVTITGIIYCIERIFKKPSSFIIATISILTLPVPVLRQAIVWTSGFANYATSAFFLLVFAVYVIEHPTGRSCRKLTLILLPLLGMLNSLLIEHSMVFNVVFSVCLICFFLMKHELRWDYIAYGIGGLLGAGLMLSNPVYRNVMNNTDYYRSVASGGIIKRVKMNFLGAILHDGYMKNVFVNSLMLGLLLILLLQRSKNRSWRKSSNTFICFCLAIIGVFVFMTGRLFIGHGSDYDLLGNYRLIMSILSLAAFFCAIISSMLLSSEDGVDYFLLSLWGAFLVILAPLFVVAPIGGRCFLQTYVILIMILCRLAGKITLDEWPKEIRKIISCGAFIFIAALLAGHFYIYGSNCVADLKRTQYIKEEVRAGKRTVTMSRLPYEYFLWYGTPATEDRIKEFERFNGIPEYIKIEGL